MHDGVTGVSCNIWNAPETSLHLPAGCKAEEGQLLGDATESLTFESAPRGLGHAGTPCQQQRKGAPQVLHSMRCSLRACWAHAGDYQPGDLLEGKYSVISVMGRGSNGVTYKVCLWARTVPLGVYTARACAGGMMLAAALRPGAAEACWLRLPEHAHGDMHARVGCRPGPQTGMRWR